MITMERRIGSDRRHPHKNVICLAARERLYSVIISLVFVVVVLIVGRYS